MKRLAVVVGLIVALGLIVTSGFAGMVLADRMNATRQTNETVTTVAMINHQGTLYGRTGNPISGPRDLSFRIFDQETGGTLLWQEDHPDVPVQSGVFSVQLGATEAPSGTLSAEMFAEPNRWLEIWVENTPLSPRTPILPVPSAMNADLLDGHDYSEIVDLLQATIPSGAILEFPLEAEVAGFRPREHTVARDVGAWEYLNTHNAGTQFEKCLPVAPDAIFCLYAYPGASSLGSIYRAQSNSWSDLPSSAGASRFGASVIWTGAEVIIWGGKDTTSSLQSGIQYNPQTNTWTPLQTAGAPTARSEHGAVWTGGEMIVWGGRNSSSQDLADGGRYNPATNTWTAIAPTSVISPAANFAFVWTGEEALVIGGELSSGSLVNGRYDPNTGIWHAINLSLTESVASRHVLWTGTKAIIILGNRIQFYDPETDMVETSSLAPFLETGLGGNMGCAALFDDRFLLLSAGIYDISTRQMAAEYQLIEMGAGGMCFIPLNDGFVIYRGSTLDWFYHKPDILALYEKE